MSPEESRQNIGRDSNPLVQAFPTQRTEPQGMSTLFLSGLGLGLVLLAVVGYFVGTALTAPRPAPTDVNGIIARYQQLMDDDEYTRANAELERGIQLHPESDWFHNELAWNLATSHQASIRDGARAVKEATEACKLTKWSNPGWIDTLASAYAETGDFKSAVNWQQYALSLPDLEHDFQDELKGRLELFQSGKAYHEDAGP